MIYAHVRCDTGAREVEADMTTEDRMMDKKEDRRGWRVDKRFSVSHLLTTLAIIVGIMFWGSKLESRTAVIENTVAIQANAIQQQLTEIKDSLRRVEDRLDKKVDR